MKTLILIIFATLLAACGPDPVDFVTKHGIQVITGDIEEVTPELVETALAFYLDAFPAHYEPANRAQILDVYSKINIMFTETPNYNMDDVPILGWRERNWLVIVWQGSIWQGALFHEITHVLSCLHLGTCYLYGHDDYI